MPTNTPAIEMHPMASTNIAKAGYDAKTQTLAVEFVAGGTYYHYKVPEELWVGLRSAASPGRYYRMNLRDNNHYPFERID